MNFYLKKGDHKLGPYSIQQIQIFLKQGLTTMTDEVWAEGWSSWLQVGDIPRIGFQPSITHELNTSQPLEPVAMIPLADSPLLGTKEPVNFSEPTLTEDAENLETFQVEEPLLTQGAELGSNVPKERSVAGEEIITDAKGKRERIAIGCFILLLVVIVVIVFRQDPPASNVPASASETPVVHNYASTSPAAESAPTVPTPSITQGTVAQPQANVAWENSLGMKFVPAGTDGLLFGIWDVRVQDFQAYVQSTAYHQTGGLWITKVETAQNGSRSKAIELDPNASWIHPGFEQAPTHPVVGISWYAAKSFCQWLTDKERKDGKLASNQSYRLPTDAEWTKAVGNSKYPWGDVWPPPLGAGNYGDEAFASSMTGAELPHIPGNDGYINTSPVGSFNANAYGLYDMGGNVWQWCEDGYQTSMNTEEIRQKLTDLNDGGGSAGKVLRGGSWSSIDPEFLLSSTRNSDEPSAQNDYVGFRIVLVKPSPR